MLLPTGTLRHALGAAGAVSATGFTAGLQTQRKPVDCTSEQAWGEKKAGLKAYGCQKWVTHFSLSWMHLEFLFFLLYGAVSSLWK